MERRQDHEPTDFGHHVRATRLHQCHGACELILLARRSGVVQRCGVDRVSQFSLSSARVASFHILGSVARPRSTGTHHPRSC